MSTVIGSVLVCAALLTIVGAVVLVLARVLGGTLRSGGASRTVRRRPTPQPPSFGSLPGLDRPVGALGDPAPDADLSSNASRERDIFGT